MPLFNPLGFNSPPLAAHGFSQGILIPRPLAAGIFIGQPTLGQTKDVHNNKLPNYPLRFRLDLVVID